MFLRKILVLGLFACSMAPMTATATIMTYDLNWTGTAGSTMAGMFTFDDSSVTDGFVRDRDGELLSLMISTSDFGGLSWTWDGNSSDPFNFNFDALNELFPVSGATGSPEAQSWNGVGVGLGLGVEGTSGRSGLLIDGSFVEGTSSFTVSERAAVPEPGTLALIGISLAGIGFARRRRKV